MYEWYCRWENGIVLKKINVVCNDWNFNFGFGFLNVIYYYELKVGKSMSEKREKGKVN